MATTPTRIPVRRVPGAVHGAAAAPLLSAISFGLCVGYLDVGILVLKKYCWNSEGYFRTASDFPWTVPLGHASLMIVPGVIIGALSRRWPRLISGRVTTCLFASLAIWMALLRMPIYGVCSLLLAAGAGRLIADAVPDLRRATRG